MTTTIAHRPGPVAHTAGRIGRVVLGYLGWYWLVVTPFFVAFSLWLAHVNGGLDAAVILYSRQGAIWFPFAQAIAMVATYLRVHVAAGMTRRTFARAALLVAGGTGTAYAVVLTVLAAVERELHRAAGWGWRVTDAVLADESSPAGLLLAELVLACVVANVAGLLVGIVYQRAGGWWGTLALPVTAGPVALVLTLLGSTPAGRDSWAGAAPALLGGALVVALTAAAFAVVTTRTPLGRSSP
ncbi:conserved hypothetical protein [Cellulomonas flavigena DSM 20109]|uniref:Uncharacterized protein n=1 Tax=Cellulomonas flavigena (strain ATCC 482 / DSM 20109 / BCRC 11376 / JCM 18109 / NBRC 3775 / NCIMB 8073 / NRS 134) TaxID=446466 RepID=D5ULN4_CELFN|nr:hypothetical protein [Cellulomonas flavigena]ADG75990.1 conserved hypothetical protein [Cellulomonas flavigena DSM 20109]